MTLGFTSAQTPQGFDNSWYYKVIQLQGASIFHIYIAFLILPVHLFTYVRLYVFTLS